MANERTSKRGYAVLDDPELNKLTVFTEAERQNLELVGLVPDTTETIGWKAFPSGCRRGYLSVQRATHHFCAVQSCR